MQYRTELKPFKHQDGQKYKILHLTDLTLHAGEKKPTSLGKEIQKSFSENTPGRIYTGPAKINTQTISPETGQMEMVLDFIKNDPHLIRVLQEEEAKGYKVLISIPKTGLPILLGKDAQEFMESKKGQRIIRRLDKQKNKN